MKHYELLCVLRGTMSEDEVPVLIEKVKETVTKYGGQIVDTKDMGKSRIAYPIKHIRYGYFNLIRFDAEPEAMPVIQDKLRLFTELLRALVTVYSDKEAAEEKNKMMGGVIDEIVPRPKRSSRDKGARGERGERGTPKSRTSGQEKKEERTEIKTEATPPSSPAGGVSSDEDIKVGQVEDLKLKTEDGTEDQAKSEVVASDEVVVEPPVVEEKVEVFEDAKEEKVVEEVKEASEGKKEVESPKETVISMEDIDRRLDEILQSDLDKV